MARIRPSIRGLGLFLLLVGPATAQDAAPPPRASGPDYGPAVAVSEENLRKLHTAFDYLYNLDFDPALALFEEVTAAEPGSAAAPAFWSSALLYRMLAEQGSLQSQLFATNAFIRDPPPVDPQLEAHYLEVREEAERRAEIRLEQNPDDVDGLFAQGLAYGNAANYSAGIEAEYIRGLRLLERAIDRHAYLREMRPDIHDTGIVLGVHDYVIGSLSGVMRFFLFVVGSSGDREQGLEYLRTTADNGEFLGPYAQVLLAMASIRENELSAATTLAEGLAGRYPRNPLLRLELVKLYRQQQRYEDAARLVQDLLLELPADTSEETLSSKIRAEVLHERQRIEARDDQ